MSYKHLSLKSNGRPHKNKKEKLVGMFSTFQKTGDELLLCNTQKDVDDFFENENSVVEAKEFRVWLK